MKIKKFLEMAREISDLMGEHMHPSIRITEDDDIVCGWCKSKNLRWSELDSFRIYDNNKSLKGMVGGKVFGSKE